VCEAASQAFPPRIKIVREVASGDLDNDDAMPLALILNELLTNAVKNGCDASGESQIRVGLANGDGFELYVEDDGPGFDFQSVRDRSSGLRLVQLLARQLRGHFEVGAGAPSRCIVRFKQDCSI
jgi:two-component sensor histidine kinase